jgi:hypothetical protein
VLVGGLLGWGLLLPGCQEAQAPNNVVLMQIGNRILTVDAYQRQLNIYRTATGADSHEDVEAERELQIRFVRQMADQLVLLEHARTLAIEISDHELETALAEIQRDYPDDVFKQLLLENAITLEEWKAALRNRLTIERVVQQELEDQVHISEEDMAQFMSELHRARGDAARSTEAAPALSDRSIVAQLRRSKTESAYDGWMADLKRQYPIEINQAALNQILAAIADADQRAGDDRRREP